MMLASDDNVLAENKVLILYLLNKLDKKMTNDALYRVVLSVEEMNYFYFQQFLLDLIANDYVMQYQNEDKTLYQITDKGKQTLELTEDILPGIIKLQVDMNLTGAIEEVNDESSITAEYTPKSENYYNITCKIIEKNETIFEIKTFAGSREQAKQIVDNWKTYTIQIYPKLIETLTANYAELNPEIDFQDSNLTNDNSLETTKEHKTSSKDNKPVDGNINLFDNM